MVPPSSANGVYNWDLPLGEMKTHTKATWGCIEAAKRNRTVPWRGEDGTRP